MWFVIGPETGSNLNAEKWDARLSIALLLFVISDSCPLLCVVVVKVFDCVVYIYIAEC